ncbi:MAG: hypothetical protein J6R80_06400 [Kiritimatiellae bacterium]|nr:hypothetical protein [Kiritimatiellia bacterium]
MAAKPTDKTAVFRGRSSASKPFPKIQIARFSEGFLLTFKCAIKYNLSMKKISNSFFAIALSTLFMPSISSALTYEIYNRKIDMDYFSTNMWKISQTGLQATSLPTSGDTVYLTSYADICVSITNNVSSDYNFLCLKANEGTKLKVRSSPGCSFSMPQSPSGAYAKNALVFHTVDGRSEFLAKRPDTELGNKNAILSFYEPNFTLSSGADNSHSLTFESGNYNFYTTALRKPL